MTIEDLLEELVGEIYDETDRDILSVERGGDGSLTVPGRFPVHDLVDIGVALPEGDYTTIAGVVLAALGRIPDEAGDTVAIDGWEATVLAVEDRATTRVRLQRGRSTDGNHPHHIRIDDRSHPRLGKDRSLLTMMPAGEVRATSSPALRIRRQLGGSATRLADRDQRNVAGRWRAVVILARPRSEWMPMGPRRSAVLPGLVAPSEPAGEEAS